MTSIDQTRRLRVVFVGHVDHGKSTLIGRIFYDTKSLPDGKVEQMQAACAAENMEFEYSFLLDALPPFVKAGNPKQFVFELIDALKSAGEGVNNARLGEDVVAKTVCRHAVKANDPLRGPELENLVNDLRRCTMPYTCPHGRPTLIEMNWRELEKKFGRTG